MPDPDRTSMPSDLIHSSFNGFRLPCGGKLLFKDRQSTIKDIACGIRITVVASATCCADPLSDGQISNSFRTADCPATVTHPRGTSLWNLNEPRACVIALVLQHGSHRAPARIQNALCVRSSGQGTRAHITHTDHRVLSNQFRRELVQKVSAPISNFGVNGLETVFLPGALRRGQRRLKVSVKTLGLHFGAIAERSQVFQTQIDSDGAAIDWDHHLSFDADRDVQVPATARVFAEAAGAQFVLTQSPAVPNRQPFSGVVNLAVCIFNCADLERQPAQRSARAFALAPCQTDSSVLSATACVLLRCLLYRLDRQIERSLTACTSLQVGPKIEACEELALSFKNPDLQVVAVIPDCIDLARKLLKPSRMTVFDPYPHDASSRIPSSFTVHLISISGKALTPNERQGKRANLPIGTLSLPTLNDLATRAVH